MKDCEVKTVPLTRREEAVVLVGIRVLPWRMLREQCEPRAVVQREEKGRETETYRFVVESATLEMRALVLAICISGGGDEADMKSPRMDSPKALAIPPPLDDMTPRVLSMKTESNMVAARRADAVSSVQMWMA